VANSTHSESGITTGQRRVVEALLGLAEGQTYEGTARALGLHVGTVYTHLARLRRAWPELYIEVMAIRASQLGARHHAAMARAAARSADWHRRQAARRHYRRFGVWPHERKFYKRSGRVDFLGP
jgi:hypothetical protein